jgi:serine/threonine protein kinase
MVVQEVQGKGYLSKAADTYSLGVLLWEMFHGMPPYAAENGHLVNNTSFPRFDLRHREDAPFSYVVVALACLSEDFEKRYVVFCIPPICTRVQALRLCLTLSSTYYMSQCSAQE